MKNQITTIKLAVNNSKLTEEQIKDLHYIGIYDCSICNNKSSDICDGCDAFDLFMQRKYSVEPIGFKLKGEIS